MHFSHKKLFGFTIVVLITVVAHADPWVYIKNNSKRLISITLFSSNGSTIDMGFVEPGKDATSYSAGDTLKSIEIKYCPSSYVSYKDEKANCNKSRLVFDEVGKTVEFSFKDPHAQKYYLKINIDMIDGGDYVRLEPQEGVFDGTRTSNFKWSLSGNITADDITPKEPIRAMSAKDAVRKTTSTSAPQKQPSVKTSTTTSKKEVEQSAAAIQPKSDRISMSTQVGKMAHEPEQTILEAEAVGGANLVESTMAEDEDFVWKQLFPEANKLRMQGVSLDIDTYRPIEDRQIQLARLVLDISAKVVITDDNYNKIVNKQKQIVDGKARNTLKGLVDDELRSRRLRIALQIIDKAGQVLHYALL